MQSIVEERPAAQRAHAARQATGGFPGPRSSSGIEHELVAASEPIAIEGAGSIPVARAEDLLATKLLSMSERRPQDRLDARGLILANPGLDLERVRRQLARIHERGFDRGKDLPANLSAVLAEVASL